jgi:CzcA family heavy metal efflux pump
VFAPLIRASLDYRPVVFLAAAALFAAGLWQSSRMPVDIFPDLTAPAVTVVGEAHGMSPLEVEQLVSFPLESAVNGAPGVRRVRSVSAVGLSVLTVEFEWGTDILRARQVVAERLQAARGALPAELPAPQLAPAASIMGEIMFAALVSETHAGAALKSTADWTVRRRLLAVPGVAEVITIGGDERQYQVTLNPERLAAHKVGVDQVLRALRATSHNIPAGYYFEGGQEYLIQGIGRVRGAADIAHTAVALRGGQPVLVRDLGEVAVGNAIVRGTASHNARPAVVLAIQKQPGANTLDLTRRLDEAFAALEGELPPGMKLETHVFRQADFIEAAIDNVLAALRDGALLVLAIVFAFLLSARATLVTLVALPLSLLAALLAVRALGGSIDTMTLGGLAIALGVLVDDAIIVVENIVRRLRQNAARPQAERAPPAAVVAAATTEIEGSIVFATFIIVLVFLPMFFLGGVEGRLLAPLGFAYIVALVASLGIALTVTPALSAALLPAKTRAEPRWTAALRGAYEALLDGLVGRWKPIALVSALLFTAAAAGLALSGRAFLPEFNEGSLTVNLTTLPGTSLAESDALAQRAEKILLLHPEVVATARRTGRAPADPHAQEIHASEIEASLSMSERRKGEFLAALRESLAALPGANVTVGQPISHRIDHMLSGTRASIAVKIFGPDLYELRRIGERVRALAQEVPGAVDVALEQQADIPLVRARLDRSAIARHGLTVEAVGQSLETAFAGVRVARVIEAAAQYDLVVRFDTAVRASIDAIRAAPVSLADGSQVPLSALADVRKDFGPNLVSREAVQRKIVVSANVAGRDLGGVVEELSARVAQQNLLPQGYRIEYGGQFETAAEATRVLTLLGFAVVAGVFLLLFFAFRSGRDALLVMLNLPLALVGGVAGLYVVGGVLSVATLIGFIALFGIAARNGVMLVLHIRHLVAVEGVTSPREAVLRGASERLLPILMTALAAGLALVPLALGAGEPGSEIQAPMATVILFGLLSSTLLNMVVVPALYLRFGTLTTTAPT